MPASSTSLTRIAAAGSTRSNSAGGIRVGSGWDLGDWRELGGIQVGYRWDLGRIWNAGVI